AGRRKRPQPGKPLWGVGKQGKDALGGRNDSIGSIGPIFDEPECASRSRRALGGHHRWSWNAGTRGKESSVGLRRECQLSNRGRLGRLEMGCTLLPTRFPFAQERQREF